MQPASPEQDTDTGDLTVDRPADAAAPEHPRSGKWFGILFGCCVVAALLGIYALGYYFWQMQNQSEQQLAQKLRALDARIGTQDTSTQNSRAQLSALSQRVANWIATSNKTDSANREQIEQLQAAFTDLQKSLVRVENDWVLSEVRYLLRMANHRVVLGGDIESGVEILQSADKVLQDLGDGNLLAVRVALAEEIDYLLKQELPDIDGIAIALRQLELYSVSAPLRGSGTADANADASPAADEREYDTWWIAYAHKLMDKLFVLRKQSAQSTPTFSTDGVLSDVLPDQRVALQLALSQARRAVVRRDQAAYVHAKAQAIDLLKQYFDTNDSGVQHALDVLESLGSEPLRLRITVMQDALQMIEQMMAPQEIEQ